MEKVGLQNIGNTCFMNSVLQALIHTPILWKAFGKSFIHYDKQGEAICEAMHDLFTKVVTATPHRTRFGGEILSISPERIVSAFEHAVRGHRNIRYRRGIQLCSAEVSRYLLDTFHTYLSSRFIMEIEPGSGDSAIIKRQTHALEAFIKQYTSTEKEKKGYSEIADKFHGQTQIITICTNCKTVSTENYESWEMLPLSIPGSGTEGATAPSLLGCIKDQFNDELIEDYWCATCKSRDKVRATCVATHAPRNGTCCRDCYKLATAIKRNRISRFPEYISIELKRYMVNPITEEPHKVIGGILWDLEDLNLEPYNAFHESPFKTRPPRYRTYAVIEHQGRTPNSGHYYARIRKGSKWFEYNDDIPVTEVSKEEVITNNSYIIYATSDPDYDSFFAKELPVSFSGARAAGGAAAGAAAPA